MKYMLAFLILTGGLIGLLAIAILIAFICHKVEDWEMDLDLKYEAYRNFKENILPWIVVAIISVLFLFCLVMMYFAILGYF